MGGDISLGDALGQIFWFMGELAFKFVPGTVASIIGTDPSGTGPIPAGLSPITEPVTMVSMVSFLEKTSSPDQYRAFSEGWSTYVTFTMGLSFVLSTGIIYCIIRIRQIRHVEHLRFEAAERTVAAQDVPKTHLRWERIHEQANSDSEHSWRLAILEADIMLNELLDLQGYRGETMADKMKQVDRAKFNTIDYAWEAHKIRNQIAHEGAAFPLNARDVRRIIGLYESVFREFDLLK